MSTIIDFHTDYGGELKIEVNFPLDNSFSSAFETTCVAVFISFDPEFPLHDITKESVNKLMAKQDSLFNGLLSRISSFSKFMEVKQVKISSTALKKGKRRVLVFAGDKLLATISVINPRNPASAEKMADFFGKTMAVQYMANICHPYLLSTRDDHISTITHAIGNNKVDIEMFFPVVEESLFEDLTRIAIRVCSDPVALERVIGEDVEKASVSMGDLFVHLSSSNEYDDVEISQDSTKEGECNVSISVGGRIMGRVSVVNLEHPALVKKAANFLALRITIEYLAKLACPAVNYKLLFPEEKGRKK